jgi:hypothetical protein
VRFVMDEKSVAQWEEKKQGFNITMTEKGAEDLDDITDENVGKMLDLYVGDTLLMSSKIEGPILDYRDVYIFAKPEERDGLRKLLQDTIPKIEPRD